MPVQFRREAPLIVLAVALTGLAVAGTRWSKPRSGPTENESLPGRLIEAPPEQTLIFQKRMVAKEQVLGRLLREELTFLEAASWFRYINDNPSEHRSNFRRTTEGHSDGEKACRQVLAWLDSHLRQYQPASQAVATLSQYESELESHLCERGEVVLPW